MQTSTPNPDQEPVIPETVEQVQADTNEMPAQTDQPQDETPAVSEPATVVSFQNVDIYQKKILILPKISFTVKQGEFVYLIGKTGSGKSSILKTLISEIKPKGEKAEIIGFDLLTMKPKRIPELRKKLGVVFQDYQLLNDKTVIENLMFVLRATRWKDRNAMLNRCEEVLSMVGLATKDFKLPYQLSGGEQQRVCIARALLNNPDVILADEPTGNLDPITAEEIFQLFHTINKTGTTVIMATHNFSMIDKFPSRTICVEDGKLIDSVV